MAKFRKNHNSNGKGNAFFVRAIIVVAFFTIVLGFGYLKFDRFIHSNATEHDDKGNEFHQSTDADVARNFLPSGGKGELVNHRYFSLSYDEKSEQSEWVAYHLTKASLKKKNVERSRQFRPDYNVSTRSAIHSDYTNSGFTRGHLAPAGDMAFSSDAMEESFMMSNMSPQLRAFNNGIWKELEETVRDWAYYYDDIYVVTGPVFSSARPKTIGKNRVAVPDGFYKVVLDSKQPYAKGIAFHIPHEISYLPLNRYALSIDALEEMTGLNFFDLLLEDSLEHTLEAQFNILDWPFDEARFQSRINKWNLEK